MIQSPSGASIVPHRDTCDLLFIGSGLSSTYTLVFLLEQLLKQDGKRRLAVTVVDPSGRFGGGNAYCEHDGIEPLLLTPLRDFLTAGERSRFSTWLVESDDEAVASWRAARGEQALPSELADECLPRQLVGRFLAFRVGCLVNDAERRGVLDLQLRADEVHDLARVGDGWRVQLRSGQTVDAVRGVVAVGTPPPTERATAAHLVIAANPTAPAGLSRAVQRIGEACDQQRHQQRSAEVLVIGANASACDVIALAETRTQYAEYRPQFTVLAPKGRLPDRRCPPSATRSIATPALDVLAERDELTAADVCAAAAAALAFGRSQTDNFTDVYDIVTPMVGSLLSRLNEDQRVSLADGLGYELGKHTRWMGEEYADVMEKAAADGRLRVITGRCDSVTGNGAALSVHASQAGVAVPMDTHFDVIVDCSGSGSVGSDAASPIIRCLATSFGRNTSDRGLSVDDSFTLAPNLYLIGPMLAGNILFQRAVWHTEVAARLIDYASRLAGILASDIRLD